MAFQVLYMVSVPSGPIAANVLSYDAEADANAAFDKMQAAKAQFGGPDGTYVIDAFKMYDPTPP